MPQLQHIIALHEALVSHAYKEANRAIAAASLSSGSPCSVDTVSLWNIKPGDTLQWRQACYRSGLTDTNFSVFQGNSTYEDVTQQVDTLLVDRPCSSQTSGAV